MKILVSRKDACDRGLKRFYTGKPCFKGHDAERFVTTGGCVRCNAERSSLFKKSAAAAAVSNLRGHFGYPLHPDDYAAALAYCQGLDLARGRIPHAPEAPPPVQEITPERMREMRALALGKAADLTEERPQSDSSTTWLRDVPGMRSVDSFVK